MSRSKPFRQNGRRFAGCMTCLGMLVFLSGCGSEEYERRLNETVKYFEYLDEVNQALSPTAWSEWGVELRVPRQFEMMPPPPPKPEEPANGETAPENTGQPANGGEGTTGGVDGADDVEAEPVVDPRQPDFVDVELPGLVAAWKAQVEATQNGQVHQTAAYLYVFSNHQRFLDFEESDQNPPASEFTEDFFEAVAQGLHVPSPLDSSGSFSGGGGDEGSGWDYEPDRFPDQVSYFPRKDFDVRTITIDNGVDGLKTDFTFYQHNAGDVQVIVMLAVPQEADARDFGRGIEKTLETMSVSSDKPSNRQPAAAAPPVF